MLNKLIEILQIKVDHEFFVDQKCNVINLVTKSIVTDLWLSLNLHLKKIADNRWSIYAGLEDKDVKKLKLFLEDDSLTLDMILQTDKSEFLKYTFWPYFDGEKLPVLEVPPRDPLNRNVQIDLGDTNQNLMGRKIANGNLHKRELIQIKVDVKEELERLLAEREAFKPSNVGLNFKTMDVILEYIIIQRNEWNHADLTLIDKHGIVQFTPLQEVEQASQERVYRSSSIEVIKLDDKCLHQIQLWKKKGTKKQLIFADITMRNLREGSNRIKNKQKIITKYLYY